METKKLKMNNSKFVKIWSAVVAVVVVLAIVATSLMNFFSLSMEIFLGRGEMVVTPNPNMLNADTKYYVKYARATLKYVDEDGNQVSNITRATGSGFGNRPVMRSFTGGIIINF